MFSQGMIVRVVEDKVDGAKVYKTNIGSDGEVIEVRQLTTKVKLRIKLNTIVNDAGDTIDMTGKSDNERIIEVNAIHCEPMNVNIEIPAIGSYIKIKTSKYLFKVLAVDKFKLTVMEYHTGVKTITSAFSVVKQVNAPTLKTFNVKVSGKLEERYIVGHTRYPFPRKYFDVENFEDNHHELFKWFKEKKDKLNATFKKGMFNGNRKKTIQEYSYSGIDKATPILGSVHLEEKVFVYLQASKYVKMMCDDRLCKFPPVTNENHVGIEIECYTKLAHKELALEFAKEGLANNIRLVRDGSLNDCPDNYTPVEIKVLVSESMKNNVLARTIKVLQQENVKAIVNSSTGLHIHIDMRNRDVKNVYENLWNMQTLTRMMITSDRRDNDYCRFVREPLYEVNKKRDEHYDGLSLSAYKKHGTIEIRFHQGSVDFYEISNWIDLWVSLADTEVIDRHYRSVEKFAQDFPMSPLLGYMKERVQKFAA